MTSYTVDVKELLESTGIAESIDAPFELGVLRVGDESFPLVEPATVDVLLTNAGSGIVASGTVSARVTAECSRCLCPFETVIAGAVEGYYVQNEPEDDEAEPISGDKTIDLAPALVAALVIEAPFAPIHDPECKGLCPECGMDLNVGSCDCASKPDASHPFAVLQGLLQEDPTEQE